MNKQIAMAALAFLERVQLQASEVDALMAVRAALNEYVTEDDVVEVDPEGLRIVEGSQ
jgi:hypothetical protein